MSARKQGWTGFLRQEGSNFLEWVERNGVLLQKLDTRAAALRRLVCEKVRTEEEAIEVCRAVPAAISSLENQSTYENLWTAIAYAGLHLLDRYARAWVALEQLVVANCLPMAKFGIRALDVGTGPGPSAFAALDFYNAMTEFAVHTGNQNWQQPPEVTCVEVADATNHLRHRFDEIIYELSQGEMKDVLGVIPYLQDFSEILPTRERKARFESLRYEEDEYYDDEAGWWTSDPVYWVNEAHDIAQSLHRYRLFIFSNFLTTYGTVICLEPNLVDTLRDANPGAVLVILGGKKGEYPRIYKRMGQLAKSAGFEVKICCDTVSWANSAVEARIRKEGKRFYQYLRNLAPNEDHLTREVCAYFKGTPPSSQLWVYRKYSRK